MFGGGRYDQTAFYETLKELIKTSEVIGNCWIVERYLRYLYSQYSTGGQLNIYL